MHLYSVALLVAAVLLANIERTTSVGLTTINNPTEIRYQNGVAPTITRLLRRSVDNEERAITGGGAISGLTTKIKSSTSKLVEKLAKINNYDDELVKNTKMDLVRIDKMLTKEKLEILARTVKNANDKNFVKKTSSIGALTARYGDDYLATTLVTVEKEARQQRDSVLMKQIKLLRKDQLNRWKNGGNSIDDVFKRLNVGDDSQKLQVLDDYIKLVKPSNSDTTLFNTLMKGFGKREDKIGALLYAAKKNPSTAAKAQKFENVLVTKWKNEGQLPANVFQWLNLYKDVDVALSADNLKRIAKYMDDVKDTRSSLSLYANSFKETDLAYKLISKIPKLQDEAATTIATKLQTDLFTTWVKRGVKPENIESTVFKMVAGAPISKQEKRIAAKFAEIYPTLT
ncbi:RxLR effector protein [Phytophthora megakarya]|uniref:RxLR effector protein n=1 Tax=Phytophthora megakarya TaxID=4795 RepID=A0A225W8J7_9STRA|nr:RxLR effector protein [Phytophthora megakarya]